MIASKVIDKALELADLTTEIKESDLMDKDELELIKLTKDKISSVQGLAVEEASQAFDIGILLRKCSNKVTEKKLSVLHGLSAHYLKHARDMATMYEGDKEQFLKEFRASPAPSFNSFVIEKQGKVRRENLTIGGVRQSTYNKLVRTARALGKGEIEDIELHKKYQQLITRLTYYYPVRHDFIDNNWLKYANCNVCEAEPLPEGHDIIRKDGILVPICHHCLEENYKIDYERLSRLYLVELLNLQHAYEEII